MIITNHNSIEKLLKNIERDSRKFELRTKRRFLFREWAINLKVSFIRYVAKDHIERDRKIVLLLSKEVFVNGGTTASFQNKLYDFLDGCNANKTDEEFNYLFGIFKKVLLDR